MKSHLLALLAATVLLGFLQPARADTDITFQDFYDALSPDGDWVELEEYGYCWRPFVDDQWRPYTDGQWVYTDAGYTWLSNEPWGWATYHYGRWTKVKNWGWVWVPGYEWGPAWVSWRTNDEYIGWAALPPEAVWEPSTGFSVFVDIDYGIGPDWYAFCPVTYFCAPRLRTVCLPWRNNITIINNTVNITKIRNVNNGIIFNDGPDINIINRRADTPLRRVRLEREGNFDIAALREGRLRSRLEGDTLKIPAPRVENKEGRPTKIAGRAGSTQINRGWDSAVKNPELAKVYRDKIREEAERSGRRPHKEFNEKPQDQPPPSRGGVVSDRPGDPSQPKRAEGSTPPTPTPRPRDRRQDLQNQPPGEVDPQRQQREEELRNRILEQRQQQNQQTEQRRQRQQENDQGTQDQQQRQQELQQQLKERRERQQQQQAGQQQAAQQEAAENARRQQAEQSRDKALRAQQEFEARREAARQQRQQEQQQQQEEASRRQEQQRQQAQEQQRQQQQQQQQSQMQQFQQQMQQQRQERQERRQGN